MSKVRFNPGDRVLDMTSEIVVTVREVMRNGYVIVDSPKANSYYARFDEVTAIPVVDPAPKLTYEQRKELIRLIIEVRSSARVVVRNKGTDAVREAVKDDNNAYNELIRYIYDL